MRLPVTVTGKLRLAPYLAVNNLDMCHASTGSYY